MLFLLILCGFISAVLCAVLVRYGRRTARRYGMEVPQRFHAGHVPRLGGVAMLLSCVAGWFWMAIAQPVLGIGNGIDFQLLQALSITMVALIAALSGAVEDVWHKLRARWRLLFTLCSAIVAVHALQLRIDGIGIPFADALWAQTPWPGIALAVLALAGLPHAFNLIDGYNGLAGTVAVICCLAITYVALQVGDREIAGMVLVLAGATAGFLLWNYPRGMIFAGDGGAYLWGVVIAVASVMLVQRHRQVSPWFPMLLLSYPVLETAFSVYRKVIRGQSPSVADALHFHQLIYRRIVRNVFDDDDARQMLMRNNRTSPYLWGFAGFTVVPAVLFWRNTPLLMVFCAAFVALYVWAYTSIVRFKVPRWIRRGD
jgi:UDP-GlcNAc:undecaprenyl-phosphate/decaprenyl-phosphate GlcNAc-1-phosphate transferase